MANTEAIAVKFQNICIARRPNASIWRTVGALLCRAHVITEHSYPIVETLTGDRPSAPIIAAPETPPITGGTAPRKGGILSDLVPGVRLIQDPRGQYARAYL